MAARSRAERERIRFVCPVANQAGCLVGVDPGGATPRRRTLRTRHAGGRGRPVARNRGGSPWDWPRFACLLSDLTLPGRADLTALRHPRQDDGTRAALRVLVAARDQMTVERTANVNALIALVRTVDLGVDARKPLSTAQIDEIARWRARSESLAAPDAALDPCSATKTSSCSKRNGSTSSRSTRKPAAGAARPGIDRHQPGFYTSAS